MVRRDRPRATRGVPEPKPCCRKARPVCATHPKASRSATLPNRSSQVGVFIRGGMQRRARDALKCAADVLPWCPCGDSNPEPRRSKRRASANWATRTRGVSRRNKRDAPTGAEGIEPSSRDLESRVLPLHHAPRLNDFYSRSVMRTYPCRDSNPEPEASRASASSNWATWACYEATVRGGSRTLNLSGLSGVPLPIGPRARSATHLIN